MPLTLTLTLINLVRVGASLSVLLLGAAGCASGPRPVQPMPPPPGTPDACGPPPVREFTGAVHAIQAEARLSRRRGGHVAHEGQPVILSTASEAYRLAELRDYQRCLLLHRDGACHALVAYYESLWTFLLTDPTAEQMTLWQGENRPPACAP